MNFTRSWENLQFFNEKNNEWLKRKGVGLETAIDFPFYEFLMKQRGKPGALCWQQNCTLWFIPWTEKIIFWTNFWTTSYWMLIVITCHNGEVKHCDVVQKFKWLRWKKMQKQWAPAKLECLHVKWISEGPERMWCKCRMILDRI